MILRVIGALLVLGGCSGAGVLVALNVKKETAALKSLIAVIEYWKNERGIELTKEESDWIYAVKSPGRPHFGQIIMNRGLATDLRTAIKEYVSPCKVGNDRIDATAAIHAICRAGGIAVWAHPLGGEGEKRLTHEEFHLQLSELVKAGIQGLECYYSRYSQEDIEFLLEEARKHNLFISAGSDYHGSNKPNLHIGKLNVDDQIVNLGELTILNKLGAVAKVDN